MQGLLKREGRILPAHFICGTPSWRRFGILTLGVFVSLLFAPRGAFAADVSNTQPEATIELSPMAASSTVQSRADAAQEIRVALTLPLSDPQGAEEFARRVSDPEDQLYRHYISAEEFAARYGANEGDYQALKDWALANGLRISQESVARTLLTVSGTVRQFEELFKTQLNNYVHQRGKNSFLPASHRPSPALSLQEWMV